MDSHVKYLLSLRAIRERAKIVGDVAKAGNLTHFELREEKLDGVVDFVASVIKRDFGPDNFHSIPPHGRWQHFEVGNVPRIATLRDKWTVDGCDHVEQTRRLIDLFFVSVLLDAGAGDDWRYREPNTGNLYERSEGIAVASLDMFNGLAFTDRGDIPIVTGNGLQRVETSVLAQGFQVSVDNPMLGVETRATLLRSLGQSLLAHPDIFGDAGRPGNIVDYLMKGATESSTLDVLVLWDTLQTLLVPIWPKDRTTIGGTPIGDAWPLSTLRSTGGTASSGSESTPEQIQPFHKLTQWLAYSLMVPFQRVLGMKWANSESLTALPEYRNGGLFVDLGALSLRNESLQRGLKASGGPLPLYEAGDDVIVEWRAMTLVLIDMLYDRIQSRMGPDVHLTMAQLLEAGTWKSGREVAAQRRPRTKSSPILIKSDGTVF